MAVSLSLPIPVSYLLTALTLVLIYRYIISPALATSSIPSAHPLAPYTNLWILWIRFRCVENRTIYAAHQAHGPVVRLGATEVSVNSLEGLKTIYGGNFDKHAWYPNIFANYRSVAPHQKSTTPT